MARWRTVVSVRTLLVATVLGVVSTVAQLFRSIVRDGPSGRMFTGLREGDPAALSSLVTYFVIGFVLGMVLITFGVIDPNGDWWF
jgi:hypothetical protein